MALNSSPDSRPNIREALQKNAAPNSIAAVLLSFLLLAPTYEDASAQTPQVPPHITASTGIETPFGELIRKIALELKMPSRFLPGSGNAIARLRALSREGALQQFSGLESFQSEYVAGLSAEIPDIASKFDFLGSIQNKVAGYCSLSFLNTVGIIDLQDLITNRAQYSTITMYVADTGGNLGFQATIAARMLMSLGITVKLISGYPSSAQAGLATKRGELSCFFSAESAALQGDTEIKKILTTAPIDALTTDAEKRLSWYHLLGAMPEGEKTDASNALRLASLMNEIGRIILVPKGRTSEDLAALRKQIEPVIEKIASMEGLSSQSSERTGKLVEEMLSLSSQANPFLSGIRP